MTADRTSGTCRAAPRRSWQAPLLTGTALMVYLLLGDAPAAWVFDRVAVAHGEWWRLLTGHWVHSGGRHAFWNIGALLLLSALFARRLQWRLPLALLAGTVGIDVWLWWWGAPLNHYCGLSGLLNSLLAAGLVRMWQELRHPLVWVTGLVALTKIFAELALGDALFTRTAWSSVPEVHAVGFACGWLVTIAADRVVGRRPGRSLARLIPGVPGS